MSAPTTRMATYDGTIPTQHQTCSRHGAHLGESCPGCQIEDPLIEEPLVIPRLVDRAELEAAQVELARLRAIIDRPVPRDFIEASAIEAKFQMDLWGTTEGFPTAFDGQEDHHFVYLIAYLAGKVAATSDEEREKKLHRITTIAAAAANWHIVAGERA